MAQVIKPGAGVESPGKCEDVPDHEKTTLQCSAPTPITTGVAALVLCLNLPAHFSCNPDPARLELWLICQDCSH